MNIILAIIGMIVLLILSAYFSATETAFTNVNKTKLKSLSEKGDRKAKHVLKLTDRYDKMISTVLIGNAVCNIVMAVIGTVFFMHTLDMGIIGATVAAAVITLLILLFGEIAPKSAAKERPEKFCMATAPVIDFFMIILTPFSFFFSLWKKLIHKMFKSGDDGKMSQEELLLLVEEVEQDGGIDTSEGTLLRNAIEFNDTRAEDILTHRVDLVAVPTDVTKEELANLFEETKFSRILVYEEDIDHVVGVIHQKDIYCATGITERTIEDLVAPVIFIQKNEKISELLEALQKNKSHLAVVLDEYGGTLGIVTMEDILEELVGEIWDEHDEVVEDYEKLEDDHYTIDGSVNMDDISELFGIEIESESVSFGGFIMELFEKIPEVGETVRYVDPRPVDEDDEDDDGMRKVLDITVTETDMHRIVKADVKVSEIKIEEEPEDKK